MKPIKKLELAIIEYQNETQEIVEEINVSNLCINRVKCEEGFNSCLVELTIKTHSII